jgi:peptidoglycan hydrolase-like protein with peptidoglycan-binding domain
MKTRAWIGLALAVSVGWGCSGEEPHADFEPELHAEPDPGEDPVASVLRVAEEGLRVDFDSAYEAWLGERVAPSALRYLLLDEQTPVPLRRQQFLATLYANQNWRSVFVGAGTLHPRAEAVLAGVSSADLHGLVVDHFLTDEARHAVATAREVGHAWRARPRVQPSDEVIDALIASLDATDLDAPTPETLIRRALDRAFASDDAVFADLRTAHEVRLELEQTWAGAAAVAESVVADAFLAWAFEQRHFSVMSFDDDLSESERHAAIAERMTASFNEIVAATGYDAAAAVVDGLPPRHPQYEGLLAERARYAQIVADGGWDRVAPMSLQRGHRHARVADLKTRLAVEGYFDGDIDEVFDEALETAVSAYQATHQMEVTGQSSRMFWGSLNTSAERRLAQIELTLQRWRENRIGDDPYYIHVNIPDFHAEVWRDGERELRFRIVVGNTDRICDRETGQWRYVNATPIQSAEMTYVVLNPYWNVPRRILEEELLVELLESETYFEDQGIEIVIDDNGNERVRQAPGPNNPLGVVKFMFPNPHNTYMHDTSRPQFFRYPIRAFSHGCMRVQNPVDLLEHLLRNDGQWDEERIAGVFESGEEFVMTFDEPIPVHVEYYVVRVDDDGRANFLADVYRYDRERLGDIDDDALECTVEPEPELRLVLGEEGRPMYRDAEGELYDPTTDELPEGFEHLAVEADDPGDPAADDIGP